jgi:hypothetical protein
MLEINNDITINLATFKKLNKTCHFEECDNTLEIMIGSFFLFRNIKGF